MPKRESWQCTCGRYAHLMCDWPQGDGSKCCKPICLVCVRRIDALEICPFHRGDPPHVVAAKAEQAEADAQDAGYREAVNAAKILGVKWP